MQKSSWVMPMSTKMHALSSWGSMDETLRGIKKRHKVETPSDLAAINRRVICSCLPTFTALVLGALQNMGRGAWPLWSEVDPLDYTLGNCVVFLLFLLCSLLFDPLFSPFFPLQFLLLQLKSEGCRWWAFCVTLYIFTSALIWGMTITRIKKPTWIKEDVYKIFLYFLSM